MSLEDRAKAASREAENARLEESRHLEEERLSRMEADTRSEVTAWFERMGVQPVPIHYDGLKQRYGGRDKDGDDYYHTYVEAHWQLEGHEYLFRQFPNALQHDKSFFVRRPAPVHPDRECTNCPHEPVWVKANDLAELGAALQTDALRVLPYDFGKPRVQPEAQPGRVTRRRRWWEK
jgi:hypothetical protein